MNKEKIKRNPLSVLALRLISPGYGYCEICGLPWNHATPKDVEITKGRGVFATCKYCWDNSSIEDVLGAYSKLYHEWEKSGAIAYVYFSKQKMISAVEKEYYETHVAAKASNFIEINSENKDNVLANLKKKSEMEYLEMQNDEYNYGHNVPKKEYNEDC